MTGARDGSRFPIWALVTVLSPMVGLAAVSVAYALGRGHVAGTDTTSAPWLALPLLATWGWWLHRLAGARDPRPGAGQLAAVAGVLWAGLVGFLYLAV